MFSKMLIALLMSGIVSYQVAPAAEIHETVKKNNLEALKGIIEKDPGLVNVKDEAKFTPLHYAIMNGNKEIVALLLEKGADANVADGYGSLPIVTAASRGLYEIVNLLLDKNVVVPKPDNPRVWGIVIFTFRAGHAKLFDRLVDAGLYIKWKNEGGNSFLHEAVLGGSQYIAEKLIKLGLPVNSVNIYGWTPLHYAAEKGNMPLVKMLIANGATIDVRNIEGKTAYYIAKEWNKNEVAEFLASKGAIKDAPVFPILKGEYLGQKLPGKIPEPFAIGIVANKFPFHSVPVFTPDGKQLYWALQDYPVTMGILESTLENGQWTLPKTPSFSKLGLNDDVPFISPDGKKFFFISRRPLEQNGKTDKENIWVMNRMEKGWSEPKPLPPVVNSFKTIHWQVSTDKAGNLYFGAFEDGGFGLSDIYCSKFIDGNYTKPENLGDAVNSKNMEHSPFISPDGDYLIFSRNDMQTGGGHLHISYRKKDGTWTKAINLAEFVKFKLRSMCPYVTPDGKYLIYLDIIGSDNMPFWVDAGFIEELRPKE